MPKIVFYKKVPQNLKVDFDHLIKRSFSWHQSGKEKKKEHDKFCSKKDQTGYVLALDNKQIIGVVIILKRRIKFKEMNLVLGGIGGVCVEKQYRRQGVAMSMLQVAMERLKQGKCDVAYLCTDINNLKNLYTPVGFVALNRPHTFLGKSGKRYTEHDAMIAPVNSPEKFKAVLTDNKPFDIGRGNW